MHHQHHGDDTVPFGRRFGPVMSVEETDVLYALAWLRFGFFHSWLAGNKIKAAMHPFLGPLTLIAVAG